MKKILFIILLFFIATNLAFSGDCVLNNCNHESQSVGAGLKKPNVKRVLSKNNSSFSVLEDLEDQIIASVNNQMSRIDTDLSLAYRKKTISVKYNMNNTLPKVNSYFSVSYGKSTVSLNYTVSMW